MEIETTATKEQRPHHGQIEVSPRNKGILNYNFIFIFVATVYVMCGRALHVETRAHLWSWTSHLTFYLWIQKLNSDYQTYAVSTFTC